MAGQRLNIQEKAKLWFEQDFTEERIRTELSALGVEERYLPEMLKEIKRLRQSKNMTSGLIFILIGAFTCLMSCIVTIVSESNMDLTLYGLTSVGIVIVFIGLYKIFG